MQCQRPDLLMPEHLEDKNRNPPIALGIICVQLKVVDKFISFEYEMRMVKQNYLCIM